jgi:hypothetical protein
MYSLMRGFLKRACNEAPETDRAAPTRKARQSRGKRIRKMMAEKASGIFIEEIKGDSNV